MRSLFICIACGCGLAATAFAQSPAPKADQDSTKKREAEAPVYNLRPVEAVGTRNRGYAAVRTTTATKTDTPLRDTPQSVSVITRDVMADQSMQSMSDVVRYIPGVTMASGEGHRDQPTIRGNSSTADFFVDGVRDDAQYYRDLYNVERVEALKGSNAMIFGRGGGGGVINRVLKEAQWAPVRLLTLEGGSFEHRRGNVDVAQPVNDALALRLNGMYEDSRTFRQQSELHRRGINPTLAWALGEHTTLRASYEFFRDRRRIDRGIPSFQGAPSSANITTYFGNPDSSYARADVHAATALFEHRAGNVIIRERARFADYDKFYQNSYAGSAVNSAGTQVNLSAYNHATPRRNVFSQTDVIARFGEQHTVLAGFEVSRQRTDNLRATGYYNGTATSYAVDFTQPTVATPIVFRQSATDADNRTFATVAAAYAQDQFEISNKLQAVAGVRFDRFEVTNHNNRNGQDFARVDQLISPRAGLIFKPVMAASLYVSYSVSHLPSTGDQFSSLTATTSTLEPEDFTNYEVGGKWDVRSNLSLSASLYQLERTNTSAPDPLNPQQIVQTGGQRTRGAELNVTGDLTPSWHVVAGAGIQNAEITSTTSAAKAGATVPLVPKHTLSLWNRYNLTRAYGAGVGVVYQSDMYAAIDNTVTLPSFTRVDGALFMRVNDFVNAQLNVENVLNRKYYITTQGNNNIMPGAQRTLRLSLTTRI